MIATESCAVALGPWKPKLTVSEGVMIALVLLVIFLPGFVLAGLMAGIMITVFKVSQWFKVVRLCAGLNPTQREGLMALLAVTRTASREMRHSSHSEVSAASRERIAQSREVCLSRGVPPEKIELATSTSW